MSLQQGASSNLFVMDLVSRTTTRLTDTAAIDTSPSFSPDGSQIVFESDRGGEEQIYVMAASGGAAKRISFGEGARYSTPVWSPKGDTIAFTRQKGGAFGIGVMKPDGIGRAHPHRRFPQRRPDLRAERSLRDVFPRSAGRRRLAHLHGRHFRPRRISGADAEQRQRPGLVAAAGVSGNSFSRLREKVAAKGAPSAPVALNTPCAKCRAWPAG